MTSNFRYHIITALKKVFIFSGILFVEDTVEEPYNKYLLLNISNDRENSILSNALLSKNIIVEILSDNFENKYTTPFLLYSLGYKYEEIASILQLSPAVVKSRIFYLQKSMQKLLIDMSHSTD